MDVSQPNNWPRIEALCQQQGWGLETLGYGAVTDQQSAETLHQLQQLGICVSLMERLHIEC